MNPKNHYDCEDCSSLEGSLFCFLDKKDLDEVNKNKIHHHYKKHQMILQEGDTPHGLFCVTDGKIKVYKTSIDGREQIVRLVKAGDFLGYRALIADELYSASAMAIEDSEICFIKKEVFFKILRSNPKLNWEFMKFLSQQLRESENFMTDMAQKPVRERVAEVLILLRNKYGSDKDDVSLLNASLSREDLASLVGTATETLIRLISDFKSQGIIETKGKKIRITNPSALLEIANLQF